MRKALAILALFAFFTGTVCAGLLSAAAASALSHEHHSQFHGAHISSIEDYSYPWKSRGDPEQRCKEQCETLFLLSMKVKEKKRPVILDNNRLFAAVCFIRLCVAAFVDGASASIHPEFRTTIAPLHGAVYAITRRLRI